jgi:hypothetical protein
MFVCKFLSLPWLLNPFSLGSDPEHGLELTNFYHSDLVYHDAFGTVERKEKIPQARRFGMRGGLLSVLTFGTSVREPSSSWFSYLRLLAIRTPLIPV